MTTKYIVPATLAIIMTIGASATYGHTGETHAERSYDPVNNEFGAYEPNIKPDRVIEVTMDDNMRFEPASIEVSKGDVLEFRVRNAGELMHEFVLGTGESLQQHAEMMKKFPGMEHDEPYMAHVPPGDSMSILWKFDKAGEFGFACLLPGHYDAGMKGDLAVK